MFPLASALRDRTRLRHVYMRMLVGSGGIALICLLGFGLLSREILSYWVGSELAYQSAGLLPIFALGCFFLALSAAPYHVVNGIGRPGFNTLFYAINAIANVALIALFALNGITLSELAWSFALANIFTSLVYQTAVEVLVWRQGLLVSS
jgi:O-antigen/teichoic acid export membrane protein